MSATRLPSSSSNGAKPGSCRTRAVLRAEKFALSIDRPKDGRVNDSGNFHRFIGRGELVRLLYRQGRAATSGILTLSGAGHRGEVFVLRRGQLLLGDSELAQKALLSRLARWITCDALEVTFEGDVTAYPPGATNQLALVTWTRRHIEAQLDGSLAEALSRSLAGARLSISR